MEWNENKAQEIVNKHKSRFSFRLTFKIVRVLVAIVFLYTVYMIVLSMSYDFSEIGKRTELYQRLAIDWTYPELTSDVGLSHNSEITPFLTQKIDIPLIRTIGKEEFVVSTFHLSKPILNMFTQKEMDNNQPAVSDGANFSFYLPNDPTSGDKLESIDSVGMWEQLDMIHEGHVADMAFSTNDYHSPEELIEIVSSYDVELIWMPVYMGELQEFEEGGWAGGNNSMSLQQPWGLSGARVMDDDYMGGYVLNLTEEYVEESQDAMLHHMQTMLTEKKRLAETLLGTRHLQERHDYLTEHGFQAYGAVVTGPVKELLKLKELDTIHSVTLGEVEYWNWN